MCEIKYFTEVLKLCVHARNRFDGKATMAICMPDGRMVGHVPATPIQLQNCLFEVADLLPASMQPTW